MERPSIIDFAVSGDASPGRGERNPRVANPLINARNSLYYALFIKMALLYARIFPKSFRRYIEFLVLLKALVSFLVLIYIHIIFVRAPATCLDKVRSLWPRDGILRVEIIENDLHSAQSDYIDISSNIAAVSFDLLLKDSKNYETLFESNVSISNNLCEKIPSSFLNNIEPRSEKMQATEIKSEKEVLVSNNKTVVFYKFDLNNDLSLKKESIIKEKLIKRYANDDEYIFEYSLEYGLLRLSPAARKKLNIAEMTVTLDPSKDSCFGDKFSHFILRELIGYKDLIMSSIATLAEDENSKGYMRDVNTGEQWKASDSTWWMAKTAFIAAFFFMIIYTISILLLLRFSHNLVFATVADTLGIFEFNLTVIFAATPPLLSVILALITLIVFEFFNDFTTTAFYIIVIIWIADHYDAICCHTCITKKYWLRFFYLYHFAFFAYHYRFNGQNSSIALITSWFFIEHSMIYFFHHYELPRVLHQAHLHHIIIRAQHQPSVTNAQATTATQEVTQDAAQESNYNDN